MYTKYFVATSHQCTRPEIDTFKSRPPVTFDTTLLRHMIPDGNTKWAKGISEIGGETASLKNTSLPSLIG